MKYYSYDTKSFNKNSLLEIKNVPVFNCPCGGLEGIPIDKENVDNESVFSLKEDANILKISSVKDLLLLTERYPFNAPWNYSVDGIEPKCADWALISTKYDGVEFDFNLDGNRLEDIVGTFGQNTIVIFNPKCIDFYEKEHTLADEILDGNDVSVPNSFDFDDRDFSL